MEMVKIEPKKEIVVLKADELPTIIKTADEKQHSVMVLSSQFSDFAKMQGIELSKRDIEYGRELIGELVQKLMEDKTDTGKVNLQSFLADVKDCAKLGLSKKNREIYFDSRNNGKTGQIDIKVKRQYQGEKSILVNFCEKKIIRFLDGIVCKKDIFEWHNDFATGLQVIDKHIQEDKDRNNINNINYAYAIAYVQEDNKLVPYTCIIDSIRINRAMQSASTKNIWSTDSRAMSIKTAYWCLKQMLEPYMTKDIEITNAIANTEDEMVFHQKETQVVNIDNITEQKQPESITDFKIIEEPELEELPTYEEKDNDNELKCANCSVVISEKVASFSSSKFGKPLCFNCQKNN